MSRTMKDSGIPWIGEIPSHWRIARLKDIKADKPYAIVDGPFGSAISTSDYQEEGVPLVRIVNLTGKTVDSSTVMHISPELAQSVNRSAFVLNDIIIAKTGATVGKCSINTTIDYGILSSSCVKISISEEHDNRFFYYLFFTNQFNAALRQACGGSTRDTINLTPFSSLLCILPPAQEQTEIADFLDKKYGEMDEMISLQEKIIEELKAYKQSIISEAVGKGLNPNAQMKDSGIEWVKHIPVHWEPITPKALFSQRKEKAEAGERQLTASQQYGVIYQDEYTEITGSKVVSVMKDFDILKHVEKGDFVISMRSFQGGLEYSTKTGSISSAYVMLIPNLYYVFPRYYRWLFKSVGYINALQSTSNMVRDGQAMRYSNFAQVPLYLVPIEEQQAIADYLDKKCSEIDALISLKQSKIDALKEYMKSIIYEYITGKKDING